jgi:SHS2 domain-containing protein
MDSGDQRREGELRPGVHELDHTADLGMRVVAESREALFERAALGMFALMWGEGEVGITPASHGPDHGSAPEEPWVSAASDRRVEERRLELRAEAIDTLLARWLQELLYLYDGHALVPVEVELVSVADTRLAARVELMPVRSPPVRELKGVTYHGLEVERAGDGWRAQVIFDI